MLGTDVVVRKTFDVGFLANNGNGDEKPKSLLGQIADNTQETVNILRTAVLGPSQQDLRDEGISKGDTDPPTKDGGRGFGNRLKECLLAEESLKKMGINPTIIDARFAKPLDEKLIMEVATNHEVLITIEEGSVGGFGSHVMQLLSDRGVFDTGLKFRSMILPDIFIDQDTPEKMYEIAGLDSLSIVTKVEETLNSRIILAKNKNKISH